MVPALSRVDARRYAARRHQLRLGNLGSKGVTPMRAQQIKASADIDLDKFRLRRFVETLRDIGEVETHDEPVSLADLSDVIASSPKAGHFKRVGAEQFEMIAAVSGSRKRLAAALDVPEREIAQEFMRRMANPQPVLEVPSEQAPVHQVVKRDDAIDLTRLPFHVQHECDGGTYISSGIDFTTDPATGKTNVGCRRLMLRSRDTMRSNLTDASDLKNIYLGCLKRGERLPVSFAIGSHPLDYMAATCKMPIDEFGLVATLRGEPVPMVRGITNGVLAPADCEMIIEGYFDEHGYRELEGPYGEFYGFYGPVHIDPVFHVTAICMRRDVLHQTVLHSGRHLSRTDSGNLASLHTEVAIWRALRAIRIEPAAVYVVPASNGRPHARVAIKQTVPGQARAAISALHALVQVKAAFIVDDDVDVFDNEEMEWAMASRFRADRDVVVAQGLPGFYADPSVDPNRTVAKIGFDLTRPLNQPDTIENRRAFPRRIGDGPARHQNARQALENGPLYFAQIMDLLGSKDGREVALELDELREQGILSRLDDGQWTLKTDE
jgi:UbiD family decarboxylase